MNGNITNDRALALSAIFSVIAHKKSLNDFDFKGNSFATSLSFGSMRFYHSINKIVQSFLKKDFNKEDLDIFCILILATYQLLYTNKPAFAVINESVNLTNKQWAKGLINAILRKINTIDFSQEITNSSSHPKWLEKKIKNQYPNDFVEIFKQNNTKAPMTLRISGNVDKYQQQLSNLKINSIKLSECKQALVLEQAVSIMDLPDFQLGSCYIQDASAQLCGQLLIPQNGDLVLDSCSAPGGKATHIAQLNSQAKIIALDNNQNRLQRVAENIKRMQLKNIHIQIGNALNQDWWNGVLFDKILLDAPCSATGVIRRHPDIKILRKASDIGKLVAIQSQMLNNMWQMLKVGGTLLYATCSILEAENNKQIESFLANHKDARLTTLNLNWGIETIGTQKLPSANFDGFYYAKLTKV